MSTCIQIPYFCRNDPTSPNPIAVPAPNAEWPTRITIRKRHAATAAATVDAFDAVIDLGSSEAVLRPRDVLRRTPRPQPPPTTPPPPREEAAILSQMRRGGAPRLSLLLLFLLLLLNLFLSLPSFNHSQVFQTIFLKWAKFVAARSGAGDRSSPLPSVTHHLNRLS